MHLLKLTLKILVIKLFLFLIFGNIVVAVDVLDLCVMQFLVLLKSLSEVLEIGCENTENVILDLLIRLALHVMILKLFQLLFAFLEQVRDAARLVKELILQSGFRLLVHIERDSQSFCLVLFQFFKHFLSFFQFFFHFFLHFYVKR